MGQLTPGLNPEAEKAARNVNAVIGTLATTRQATLLALCGTLDAAIAGSLALADAPLLAAALALRTSCGLEAATYANVGLDVTNPRLT
jgi:hypothetical protein